MVYTWQGWFDGVYGIWGKCRPYAEHRRSIPGAVLSGGGAYQPYDYDAYGGGAEDADWDAESFGVRKVFYCREICGLCAAGYGWRKYFRRTAGGEGIAVHYPSCIRNYVSLHTGAADSIQHDICFAGIGSCRSVYSSGYVICML